MKRKISDIELKATEVNRFEKTILNTEDSESIGYIVACSGSGKTTYLHHLLFSHPEIKKIIFDLNRDSGDLLFCNRVVDLNSHIGIDYLKSTDTIYKFIRVILEKLNEIILLDNLKESMGWTKENKYIKYMRYLSLISKRFFCIFDKEDNISVLHRAYKDIFILFKDYDSDANRQVQVDKHCKFTEALFAKFIECAKIYCDERKSVKRDNCLISYIIQFIIILSVCCISEDNYNNRDYKFVFAFDNIEYYINEEAVYDEDILQIEEVLSIIVSNMESFLGRAMEDKPIKEVFRSHFKFLMLVRDSTNFLNGVKNGILVGTRQDEDYMRSYIDITDMYTLSKRYQRRCQKLSEYGLLTTTDEGICEVMQDIISDSTIYDNSSAKMLDDMFNHNKRRITLYLLDPELERSFIREERRIILHSAMNKLKSDYRQVLWLIYFEGMSNKEAAAVMKKSVHNIEALVSRACKSLKKQLETEGFDYEDL